MNVQERVERYLFNLTPEEQLCINCKHFCLHYVPDVRGYDFIPISSGHCVYPRIKPRKAYDTCGNFTPSEKSKHNR